MSRKIWGILTPVAIAALAVAGLPFMALSSAVKGGIALGTVIALVQSLLSVWAMNWAIDRDAFYWVWGGGIFLRMLVFVVTGFVIFKFTGLSFAATLISLALASTLFIVTESSIVLWTKKT